MSDEGIREEPGQDETIIEQISTNVTVFNPDRAHQQKFISTRREQLAQARTELEAIVSDLESDYDLREYEFWKDVIRDACNVRKAIRVYRTRGRNSDRDLQILKIDKDVDEIGIITTAHIDNCNVKTEKNMRERHRILEQLRHLLCQTIKAEQAIDKDEGGL